MVPQMHNTQSLHPFWPKSQSKAKRSDLHTTFDSENSSLTEEIFAGALDQNQTATGSTIGASSAMTGYT